MFVPIKMSIWGYTKKHPIFRRTRIEYKAILEYSNPPQKKDGHVKSYQREIEHVLCVQNVLDLQVS
jgi:hypothetical protein